MKKINDYIIYRKDVCQIVDIKKIKDQDYYVLVPENDSSLKLTVPTSNTNFLRELISKKEVENIIAISRRLM